MTRKSEIFNDDRISVIELNGILFGIDIIKSREVIPLPSITPLPNSNESYLGVFNLRGEIFPLIDISVILGLQQKKMNQDDMVIIIDGKNTTLGVLAEKVHSVRRINNNQIKSTRGVISKRMEKFVTAIFADKTSEIYLLDIDQLFTSSQLRTYC